MSNTPSEQMCYNLHWNPYICGVQKKNSREHIAYCYFFFQTPQVWILIGIFVAVTKLSSSYILFAHVQQNNKDCLAMFLPVLNTCMYILHKMKVRKLKILHEISSKNMHLLWELYINIKLSCTQLSRMTYYSNQKLFILRIFFSSFGYASRISLLLS